jgi:xylose isomerase
MTTPSYHSICRWTFNAGNGGFLPGNIRPEWAADTFGTKDMVELVAEKIEPRLPENIALGIELHYDTEICEKTVDAVADAMTANSLHLAMITPGAHSHFAYGGLRLAWVLVRSRVLRLCFPRIYRG